MAVNNVVDLLPELMIKIPMQNLLFEVLLDDGFTGVFYKEKVSTHSHSVYEVFFVRSGQGVLYTETEEQPLGQGQFCIIGPGVYHRIKEVEDRNFERYYIKFRIFLPSSAAQLGDDEKRVLKALESLTIFAGEGAGRYISLIESIYDALEEKNMFLYPQIQAYFTLILIGLLAAVAPASTTLNDPPQRIKDEKRSKIIEDFFDAYREKLTTAQLAAELNVSTRQLSRIMRELYQCSFKQKLIDMRLAEAKRLLRNTDMCAEEVSYSVGYEAVQNFYKLFRQKVGMSPNGYRKTIGKLLAGD